MVSKLRNVDDPILALGARIARFKPVGYVSHYLPKASFSSKTEEVFELICGRK